MDLYYVFFDSSRILHQQFQRCGFWIPSSEWPHGNLNPYPPSSAPYPAALPTGSKSLSWAICSRLGSGRTSVSLMWFSQRAIWFTMNHYNTKSVHRTLLLVERKGRAVFGLALRRGAVFGSCLKTTPPSTPAPSAKHHQQRLKNPIDCPIGTPVGSYKVT